MLKYKNFFKFGTRKFYFPKYQKLFKSGVFFLFFELGKLLLEIKKFCFLKYKEFFLGFHFLKFKKVPFLEIKEKLSFEKMQDIS